MQTNLITDSFQELREDLTMVNTSSKRYPDFANRFREVLKDKAWGKYTRKELGNLIGVSSSLVTYWFNGDRLPTVDQASHLGELFDCQVEWLLTGKGSKRFEVDITDEKHYRILTAIKSAKAAIEADGSKQAIENEQMLYRFAVDKALAGPVTDAQLKAFLKMLIN